jgi:prevent-host-death family protein
MGQVIKITATEANRNFSKLLREVGQGAHIKITSHGRDIAELTPPTHEAEINEKRSAAIAALKAEWAIQPHVLIGPWNRDDICSRF